MRRAMTFGSSGAVWGITQSAMVCPFAMGMVFFGVAPTLPRLGGIVLILTGIVLFSRSRGGYGAVSSSGRWLLPTFTAFAVSGLGQSLANLPSYWTATAMGSELRACLVQLGTISLFCASVPFRRKKPSPRGTLRPVLLLSMVQILALFFFFYRGLNLVAEAGSGSVGYPVAQGCSIAGFLVWGVLTRRERFSLLSAGAACVICAGIFLLAM